MKTMMKTLAMLSLSACILVGGAVSSFAAGTSTYTANVLSHQTNSCEGTQRAEMVVRFSSPYGATQTYTICGECGDVNGVSTLSKVSNATANFSGLKVYQGTLDNGERIMTVSCLSSGYTALTNVSANVMMPSSNVEGYDLYLVNADGTETKLDASTSSAWSGDDWAHIDVYMDNGTALIRMVPQA